MEHTALCIGNGPNGFTGVCSCAPTAADSISDGPPAISTLRDIADPATFWSTLTPAQALALLKAGPKKVADVWRKEKSRWTRRTLVGDVEWVIAVVYDDTTFDFHGDWFTHEVEERRGGATGRGRDVAAAKAAADAALRAANWLLVDE